MVIESLSRVATTIDWAQILAFAKHFRIKFISIFRKIVVETKNPRQIFMIYRRYHFSFDVYKRPE